LVQAKGASASWNRRPKEIAQSLYADMKGRVSSSGKVKRKKTSSIRPAAKQQRWASPQRPMLVPARTREQTYRTVPRAPHVSHARGGREGPQQVMQMAQQEITRADAQVRHSTQGRASEYLSGQAWGKYWQNGMGSLTEMEKRLVQQDDEQVEHEDAAGIRDLQVEAGVKKGTQTTYGNRFQVLEAYCETQGWDPYEFSLELAYCFASFMLRRRYRGRRVKTIEGYFAAFNAMYRNHTPELPESWKGPAIAKLKQAFYRTQQKMATAAGDEDARMRRPVPPSIIELIVNKAERCEAATERAWYAVFILMFLLGYRADTIAGLSKSQDIRFGTKSMSTVVNRLKRGDAHIQPLIIETPKGSTADHPRSRALAVIETARAMMGPELWGDDPTQASARITEAMETYLGEDIQAVLPEHCFCSSHSFRKAGASTLQHMRVSEFTIKRWGLWKTLTSPERYCDQTYNASPFTMALMDHLLPQTIGYQTRDERYEVLEIEDDDIDAEMMPKDIEALR
jgi:hypothetical protein